MVEEIYYHRVGPLLVSPVWEEEGGAVCCVTKKKQCRSHICESVDMDYVDMMHVDEILCCRYDFAHRSVQYAILYMPVHVCVFV